MRRSNSSRPGVAMTSLALDVGTSELTGLRLHARHPLTRQFYLTAYPLLMTVSFQGFTQLGKACTEESLLCYYRTVLGIQMGSSIFTSIFEATLQLQAEGASRGQKRADSQPENPMAWVQPLSPARLGGGSHFEEVTKRYLLTVMILSYTSNYPSERYIYSALTSQNLIETGGHCASCAQA